MHRTMHTERRSRTGTAGRGTAWSGRSRPGAAVRASHGTARTGSACRGLAVMSGTGLDWLGAAETGGQGKARPVPAAIGRVGQGGRGMAWIAMAIRGLAMRGGQGVQRHGAAWCVADRRSRLGGTRRCAVGHAEAVAARHGGDWSGRAVRALAQRSRLGLQRTGTARCGLAVIGRGVVRRTTTWGKSGNCPAFFHRGHRRYGGGGR